MLWTPHWNGRLHGLWSANGHAVNSFLHRKGSGQGVGIHPNKAQTVAWTWTENHQRVNPRSLLLVLCHVFKICLSNNKNFTTSTSTSWRSNSSTGRSPKYFIEILVGRFTPNPQEKGFKIWLTTIIFFKLGLEGKHPSRLAVFWNFHRDPLLKMS